MNGRKKGIFYTTFAIFVLALVYLVLTLPLGFRSLQRPGQNLRIDEEYYFLQSVKDDFGRANYIAGRRALAAASNYVVTSGTPLNNSGAGIRDLLYNETIEGNHSLIMENSSLRGWADKIELIAGQSDFNLSLSFNSLNLSQTPSSFIFNLSYLLNIRDPRSQSSFSKNQSLYTEVGLEDLLDTLTYLRSDGDYSTQYHFCNLTQHSYLVGTGSQETYELARDWNSGRVTLLNQSVDLDQVEGEENKVAVVDDPCAFSQPQQFEDFAGVVAEASLSNLSQPCGLSFNFTAFIGGLNQARDLVEDNQLAVLNQQQLWVNNIIDQLERGCYFSVDKGPTFLDRLENNLTSDAASSGLARFLDLRQVPPNLQEEKSALDFVYWNQSASYGGDQRVKGVTNYYSWFRLDQDHSSKWGLSNLTY